MFNNMYLIVRIESLDLYPGFWELAVQDLVHGDDRRSKIWGGGGGGSSAGTCKD